MIGKKMRQGWQKLADDHNLEIDISGIPSLSTYSFKSNRSLEYKTLLLKKCSKKDI